MRDYEFVRFVSSLVKILVPLWSPHPNNLISSYHLERHKHMKLEGKSEHRCGKRHPSHGVSLVTCKLLGFKCNLSIALGRKRFSGQMISSMAVREREKSWLPSYLKCPL